VRVRARVRACAKYLKLECVCAVRARRLHLVAGDTY